MIFKFVINNRDPDIDIHDEVVQDIPNHLHSTTKFERIHKSAFSVSISFSLFHFIRFVKDYMVIDTFIEKLEEGISPIKKIYKEEEHLETHHFTDTGLDIWLTVE